MERAQTFTKVDLTPKRWHAYSVFLFIAGTLFPPLAVAARFGIGSDFWLNLLLTICGYFPGHGHNFYIQNIRNNKNNKRTPKWAQKYGLVDTTAIERRKKRTQWANRYNDRLPQSTHQGQAYAEGQEGGSSIDLSTEGNGRNRAGEDGLWRPEDEQYYGQNGDSGSTNSGGRWHYPANFEDTLVETAPKKKKKEKKDRWARTEDAYSVTEGDPAPRKRKKSKRSKPASDYNDNSSRNSGGPADLPEGPSPHGSYDNRSTQPANGDNIFSHQF